MGQTGVLTKHERGTLRALCAIYASRLVGLYMVLPVLSPYAARLSGATSLLIGLSLGAYGATQAVLQIPFGYLSDRIGRRRAINLGLVLFAVGSLVAAAARTAWLLVLGRALQGSGAVSSVLIALIADLTRAEVRTQAMARVGIWIGATFALSVVVGPTVAGLFGVPVLFIITAVGAVVSIVYMDIAIPNPPPLHPEERLHAADLLTVLRQPPLLLIDAGIFLLHIIVTVLFVVMPFDLERIVGVGRTWMVLVPAVVVGLAIMRWMGRWSDRHHKTELVFFLGAGLLGLSCLVFALIERVAAATLIGLFVFVVAISTLEPVITSLLSRFAHGPHRGTATGVFSMAQFAGAFFGGILGGAFLHRGQSTMFLGLFVLTLFWGVGLTRVGHLHPLEGGPAARRALVGASADPPQGGDERVEEVRETEPQRSETGAT